MKATNRLKLPRLLAGGLALGLCLATAGKMARESPSLSRLGEATFALPVMEKPLIASAPVFRSTVTADVTPSVHAASAVEIDGGKLRAFWFGGSREGAADVSIWSSVFDPEVGLWSEATVALDRESATLACGRHIRKLGNPVVSASADGTLHLFTVAVSLGGWSGGRILHSASGDSGHSWSPPKKLVASPFFNISTLVKAPALPLSDGSFALPAYHELIGKFPQLFQVNAAGEVIDRANMHPGGDFIQPWIVPSGKSSAQAYMRRWFHVDPPEIHRTETNDGGLTWSPPKPVGLPNPNASVAAVALNAGEFAMAYNHHDENRTNLCLALSTDDGKTFEKRFEVESKSRESDEVDEDRLEYSYPWLMRDSLGNLHLLYTWNRTEIRHFRFSRDLLNSDTEGGSK